jgi:hypothetical protein
MNNQIDEKNNYFQEKYELQIQNLEEINNNFLKKFYRKINNNEKYCFCNNKENIKYTNQL